ncbi:MAG: undecaprenyldiphospho-muramoylpentapeptide beta-N-acetylglucosaminyltransferase [Deltaproteobacteria bacterium]|nr:undecaprenyldiphospho-muramoylpentapeptide beta-N-acetylglucosaminyltransferase [Deltaproteobacteria bacterium]
MKLMIAGGGTGGHLFPGIALAGAWVERAPKGEVFFVGTERGLEVKIVPAAGYRLELIDQVGIKRRGLVQTLKGLFMLPKSILQSMRIVRREKPAVAVGVGGYAAGPAILAAWLLRVPTLILEPNAVPGLTNRILAKIARVAISPYERAAAYFGKKLVKAGIPVRPQIANALKTAAATAQARRGVLVFGGSQGAKAINDAVMQAAPRWAQSGVRVVHQTGPADRARVEAAYAGMGIDVRDFIHDMAAEYAACDLVVCRAGASSLAELALCGKPAVLIPLPTAADDHQTKNAQAFADAGAGVLLRQSELTPERLDTTVRELLGDVTKLMAMADAAKKLGDPDAASRLADMCINLAESCP